SGHERDALIVAILTRCKTLHPVPLSPLVAFYIFLFLFLSKEMGRAMDNFTKVLGVVMLVLTLYVAVVTKPPLGEGSCGRSRPPTFRSSPSSRSWGDGRRVHHLRRSAPAPGRGHPRS
ncbi:MAG: hypothetical protein LOD90_10755, partial [Symbiobacteriaceae bacterium]